MIKDIPGVIKLLTDGIKKATDIATIGVSGGADSTLVTILSMLALGKENVYVYSLPHDDKDIKTFNKRSSELAKQLGVNHEILSIGKACLAAAEDSDYEGYYGISSLNYGNIKSRMRMIYLYTMNQRVAEKTGQKCRVIGTGNLSEDFIGYDTKGGDALADIFPIGELFKSEVYQLLDFFVEKGLISDDLVDRIPSAGLEDGQTDEKDLGYSYNEMEPVIKYCLENYTEMSYTIEKEDDITQFVWKRHVANKHKHMAPFVLNLGGFHVCGTRDC